MVKKRNILKLVILIFALIHTACAGSLEIEVDQLTVSGIAGNTLSSSFEIRNTGSANITGISFHVTNTLTHSEYNYTIPASSIIINSGSNTDLEAGISKLIGFTINIPGPAYPGSYIGTVTASNGGETDTLILIVNVQQQDITPPLVVTHAPIGRVTTSSIMLTITTNEEATCKYSTVPGITYDNMDGTFSSTGSTTHLRSLTGLVDGTYHYYVKCKDAHGNTALMDYDATFTLDTFPKAEIILKNPSPVKAGTVEITLTTSEPVQSIPFLAYGFDGSSYTYIPLTGSASAWTGYMIIPETAGHKVGSFKFSGTDLLGNTGNTIVKGGIFIVDTEKPSQVLSIESTSEEDGSIKISWYHNEESHHYNLYKSALKGVDYTDFYETVQAKALVDADVEPGETYYYKVAAVDEAGNEGPLSREAYATARIGAPAEEENTAEPVKLAAELIGSVDKVIKTVDETITDIDTLVSKFETSKDKELFEKIGFAEQANKGKAELGKLKLELESLKSQDLSQVELDKKLKRLELNIRVIKKSVPENALILEEKEIVQHLTIDGLKSLLDEIHKEMTEEEKEGYVKLNKGMLEKISVKTKAKIISIGYLDGTEEEITFVQKDVSSQDLPENAYLVDVIPKSVAESTSSIDFKTPGYEVLEEDPVIRWENKDSIVYVIKLRASLKDLEESKLFPLLPVAEKEDSARITGLATANIFSKLSALNIFSNLDLGIIVGTIIILGLSAYYFFFVKNINALRLSKNILGKIKKRNRKKEESNNVMYDMLSRAHKYVDEGMTGLAGSTYDKLIENYGKLSIEDENKETLHAEIVELCNRIDASHLKSLIAQAQDSKCIERPEIHDDIRTVFETLPESLKSEFQEKYPEILGFLKK